MSISDRTKRKTVVLTALGFSLAVGSLAANGYAATGAASGDPADRLARLSQARGDGALELRFEGLSPVRAGAPAAAQQPLLSASFPDTFASNWSNSNSSRGD